MAWGKKDGSMSEREDEGEIDEKLPSLVERLAGTTVGFMVHRRWV